MAENDDRSEPSGSPVGGGEMEDRIARARESIGRSLRDIAAEAERDEAALRARAADELSRIASAELAGSLEQLESKAEDLITTQLSAALARLSVEAEAAGRAQLAQVRKVAQATIDESLPKRSRRERRQELKLARAESSRRVSQALTKLEQRGGSLIGELDARLARADEALAERAGVAARRIAEAEQRLRAATSQIERAEGQAARPLAAALRRVERVGGEVGRFQARLAEIEGQALASASRAGGSAALAMRAAELESKLRDAVKREAQAADRIAAAERRLLDTIASS